MICDENPDCPNGEDEDSCEDFRCAGLLRCRSDGICVHLTDICDGIIHCLVSQDDEKLCGMLTCPPGCVCRGTVVMCALLSRITALSVSVTALILTQHHVKRQVSFGYFVGLQYLKMTNCSFDADTLEYSTFGSASYNMIILVITNSGVRVVKSYSFKRMTRLNNLDLHNNDIHEIHPFNFNGLMSIVYLNLTGYNITMLGKLSFVGLSNLEHLNLSANRIHIIKRHTYFGLISIRTIDLRRNVIKFIAPLELFSSITILHRVSILVDNVAYCCSLDKKVNCSINELEYKNTKCVSLKKSTSSIFGITYSLLILIFSCIIIVTQRNVNKSSHYTILRQLVIANLLQTTYVILTNSVILYYKEDHVFLNITWMKSYFCQILATILFASFLSTKLLIFVMVLNQYYAVKYPLIQSNWSAHNIWKLCGCWIFVALVAIIKTKVIDKNLKSIYCESFLLTNASILQLVVACCVLIITCLLVIAIPITYLKIAKHVKVSNMRTCNKNAAHNQKLIFQKCRIHTLASLSTWLPMCLVMIYSSTHSAHEQTAGMLVDYVIHLSESILLLHNSYEFSIFHTISCHRVH